MEEWQTIKLKRLKKEWWYFMKFESRWDKVWLLDENSKKIRWLKKVENRKYYVLIKPNDLSLWNLSVIEYYKDSEKVVYRRIWLWIANWEDVKWWIAEKAFILNEKWKSIEKGTNKLKNELVIQWMLLLDAWNYYIDKAGSYTVVKAKQWIKVVCNKIWEEKCKKLQEVVDSTKEEISPVIDKAQELLDYIPYGEMIENLWDNLKWWWWAMIHQWWKMTKEWSPVCAGWVTAWITITVWSEWTLTIWWVWIAWISCAPTAGWALTSGVWWIMYMVWDGLSWLWKTVKYSKDGWGSGKGFTWWNSHTLVNIEVKWWKARVDVEYPTSKSSWNVHVQYKWKWGNWKIYLDSEDDIYKLPKDIRKNPKILEWIRKAFRNLRNFRNNMNK